MKKKKKTTIILLLILLFVIIITIYNTSNFKQIKIKTTETFNEAYYKEIKVKNVKNVKKLYHLIIEITDISPELMNENFNFILTKKSEYDETYYEIQGNNAKYLTTSPLINKIYFTLTIPENKTESYRIYFWNQEKNNKKLKIKYKIKLKEIIEDKKITTNNLNKKCENIIDTPKIKDGLIAVKILNDGTVKTIENNNDWYNYCEKRWANSVLIKKESRNKYLNKKNIEIKNEDILAYFVWIPRYSYKLWTTKVEEDKFGKEQEIEIKFIDKKTKDNGKKINQWYTHPAFTFGNTELSGIWVGKFEITGTIESPTILPNKAPIVNQNLNAYLKSSLLFSGGNIINNEITFSGSEKYGLSKETNSHLIKNSEWGAITYLANSKYGINDKIRINNYFNKVNITGCGALKNNEQSSDKCDILYGSKVKEYPQSTTGNITGIFDMSGGTGEYVMTYLNGNNNLSGIDKNWFANENNKKYYDFYDIKIFNKDFKENIANCNLKTCGGHAIYETFNWYMTVHNFSDNEYNFIKRGCGNFSYMNANQYCIGYGTGEKGGGTSSRVILITEKN